MIEEPFDDEIAESHGEELDEDETEIAPVIDEVREFFLNPEHWIYTSRGTPSDISPNFVYHIGQLEVLFEDRYFHFRTNKAVRRLRNEGFLADREVKIDGTSAILVWRHNVRYMSRLAAEHEQLIQQYSSETMNKATGDYAETLTLLGLSRLHFDLIARNSREYRGVAWDVTEHDLDFILEKDGVGYGVEVKNTWKYFPADELAIKLKMCKHLNLRPLFIARNRHSGQWNTVKAAGGLLYIFKSKVFPPGYEHLTKQLWLRMRLPVANWNDWPGQFYPTMTKFVATAPN